MRQWSEERNQLVSELDKVEKKSKAVIEDLENQLTNMKTESLNIQMDKDQLENQIRRGSSKGQAFINEVDTLQEKIRIIELEKEKMEQKNIDDLYDLKNVLLEAEDQNHTFKSKITKLEKKIVEFREKYKKDMDELREINTKQEKELNTIRNKFEVVEKEKSYLQTDYEECKKVADKLKIEYKEMVEKMKDIKDNQNMEIKNYEKTVSILEQKLKNEKVTVKKLSKKALKPGNSFQSKPSNTNTNPDAQDITDENQNNDENILTKSVSLSDCIQPIDDTVLIENSDLKKEVESLNNNIQELNVTVQNQEKLTSEIHVLNKQNVTLKMFVKEIQEMYEGQIKDLQHKTVSVNAEYQSFRRATSKKSAIGIDAEQMTKLLVIINDSENKIKGHKGQIKFFQEKIEILNRDVENQKNLREKEVKYLKEDVIPKLEEEIKTLKEDNKTISMKLVNEINDSAKIKNELNNDINTLKNNALAETSDLQKILIDKDNSYKEQLNEVNTIHKNELEKIGIETKEKLKQKEDTYDE